MRKLAFFAGVAAIALGAPTAGAAGKSYDGTFEPGGTLAFKLEKTKTGKKIFNYRFKSFPLQCSGGPNTTSGNLTFAVRVKNNKFSTVAVAGNDPQNPAAKLSLAGTLKPNGNAKGTMKIEGSKVDVDSGRRSACSSPRTDWSASSGR